MTPRAAVRILATSLCMACLACSGSTGGSSGTGGAEPNGSGGTSSGGSGGGPARGTGGGSGSGGTTASGGTKGSGGTVGSGGSTASGGTNASGGSTASGGATSHGGAGGRPGGSGGRPPAGGTSGSGGSPGSAGSIGTISSGMPPCDIYAMANTPCVAAISTVRILLSTYKGPLYQVRKGGMNNVFSGKQPIGTVGGTTGGTTQDIGATADGFGDAAAQDAFCGTDMCTISKLYDQSGKGNDLTESPAGQYEQGPDYEVPATHSLMVGGHRVYSAWFPNPPMLPSGSAPSGYGYRNNKTNGMPTKTASQGVYMVADGTHSGNGCCFDFGNAETNNGSGPTGAMAAINLGTSYWGMGQGSSPWFEGDFEAGVWAGGSSCGTPGSGQLTCSGRKANPQNPSMKTIPFAFGILKTGNTNNTPTWTLKVGDATTGALTTAYDGEAPGTWQLQGALLLGTGGDNSNSSWGTFFEGAVTAGQPTAAADDAVHANIIALEYGK